MSDIKFNIHLQFEVHLLSIDDRYQELRKYSQD